MRYSYARPLLACLGALLICAGASAQLPFNTYKGKQIVVTKRAEVNMAALARLDQVLPVPPQHQAVHEPLRDPRVRPNGPVVQAFEPDALDGGGGGKDPSNLITDFLGIDSTEENFIFYPPDTHGAVGPNHLMTSTNNSVRIHNRDGSVVSTVTQATFFSALGTFSFGPFDPKVIYDKFGDRFVLVALDGTGNPSDILLAVSKTGDPTGNWYEFRIKADPDSSNWFDYPKIGANSKWVVVSGNMFPNSANYTNALFIFDKAKLYAGTSATLTRIEVPDGFNLSVSEHNDDGPDLYSLDEWNGGAGQLRLLKISGAVGSETVTTVGYPTLPVGWGGAPLAPQQGSGSTLETLDPRVLNTYVRNGYIWGVHDVGPLTGPSRCAVQWFQIALDGTLAQSGRIEDVTGNDYFFMGSIAVNGQDGAVIGFSKSSLGMFPSAGYAYRFPTDPPGTFHPDFIFKNGAQPWDAYRWGDYSATVVDPIDDTNFWTVQEYTPSSYGNYGLWWANISGTPPFLSVSLNPNPVFAGQMSTGTVTLQDPAPAGGIDVALSSSNPPLATVPSFVHINQGQTQAQFPVQTADIGAPFPAPTITATYNQFTAKAVLKFVSVNVVVDPSYIFAGDQATGTIQIGLPAPPGGVDVALSSSYPAVASVPASVHLNEGDTQAQFIVQTDDIGVGKQNVDIGAVMGPNISTFQITVVPYVVAVEFFDGLFWVPTLPITGGQVAQGRVIIAAEAPTPGGTVVNLVSQDPNIVQVTPSITVPAGQIVQYFYAFTRPVPYDVPIDVRASARGSSAAGTVIVLAPVPTGISLSPTTVEGGKPSGGTVYLSGVAPNVGLDVALSSDKPEAIVPSVLHIQPGKNIGTFVVNTVPVANKVVANIKASYNLVSVSAPLTITGAGLQAFSINPTQIAAGMQARATAVLSSPAPAGGVNVALSYVNGSALVNPPATLFVPGGSTTGSATLTGAVVTNSTPVTVTATYKSTSKQATVTVLGNRVVSVTANPQTLHVNTKAACKVYIASPAPAAGVVVNLAATSGQLLATVKVLAGQTSAAFLYTAPAIVPPGGKATITATYPAGVSVTTVVNIIP